MSNIGKKKSLHLRHESNDSSTFLTPLLLVVVSYFLAVLTVSDLHQEAHISVIRGTLLFLNGLVFFTSAYNAVQGFFFSTDVGRRVIKRYKLTRADVLEISNKQVSAVQALFCCYTGATCCLYSCNRNILRTSHYISEAYAWFGAAYFFYDVWSMYKVHRAEIHIKQAVNGHLKSEPESLLTNVGQYLKRHGVIVGHHVFIGIYGFLVITHLRGGFGDCFFGFVYLMEASTPFVSARGILSKMGLKNSLLYIANGIAMLVTFFLCRVAMFPYVLYSYGQVIGLDFVSTVLSLPRGCIISILVLVLPQIYWFYLMLKGATKIFTGSSSSKTSPSRTKSK